MSWGGEGRLTLERQEGDTGRSMGSPGQGWVHQLIECLDTERTLLERLEEILQHQRDAVRSGSLEDLEEGTHGARRVLRTLAEARRKREAVLEMGTGDPTRSLTDVEPLIAGSSVSFSMTRASREAAARRVALTLSMNRRLLEEAVHSTDRAARTLLGTPDRIPSRPGTGPERGRPLEGGTFLNRRA